MDFTILAVVLLIGVGVPIRNKLIRKYRDKKKQEDNKDKLKLLASGEKNHSGSIENNQF